MIGNNNSNRSLIPLAMDLVSEFIVAIQPMVIKTSTFQNESVFQHFQLHTDRTSVRRASNMINLERIRQDQGAGSRGVGPPRSQSERSPPADAMKESHIVAQMTQSRFRCGGNCLDWVGRLYLDVS